MINILKKIFYTIIKAIVYCFYPIYFLYQRFIINSFEQMVGTYWVNRIKNRGEDLRIHGSIKIIAPGNFEIGDYCRIGKGCFFLCVGGLKVGNNVQFSRNITIYTANHNYKSDMLPYNNEYITEQVIIGDNVWIGMNASILPGVKIGNNAIIGLGSIITKDVPDNAIVVGNNKIIKYRTPEQLELSKNNYFGKSFPNA